MNLTHLTGWQQLSATFPCGHPRTLANTYKTPNRYGGPSYRCRECHRKQSRERYRAHHGVTRYRAG